MSVSGHKSLDSVAIYQKVHEIDVQPTTPRRSKKEINKLKEVQSKWRQSCQVKIQNQNFKKISYWTKPKTSWKCARTPCFGCPKQIPYSPEKHLGSINTILTFCIIRCKWKSGTSNGCNTNGSTLSRKFHKCDKNISDGTKMFTNEAKHSYFQWKQIWQHRNN